MSRRQDHDRDIANAIDAAARAWADGEGRAVNEHPDPEELVDYQEGRLDAEGVEHLQRHLLVCPACREELLKLHAFDEEVPEGSALLPSEEMTESGWRRFQAARAATRAAPKTGGSDRSSRMGWRLAASIVLALAAGAMLTALLLGRARPDRIAETGSPFVFDVDPAGTIVERDAAVLPEIVVPAGMDLLVPRLNLGDLTSHEGYLVEVYDDSGRFALRRSDLQRERSGSVTFLVHRAEWPAGDYRVLLIALDGGQRQELASYAFRLLYEQ